MVTGRFPVAVSGLLALTAGWLQPYLVPDPVREVRSFVMLWSAVAVLSLVGAGAAMVCATVLPGRRTREF